MPETLAALAALWLAGGGAGGGEGKAGRIVGNSVSPHWRRTRVSLGKHLVSAIGHVRLDELTAAHLWDVQAYCEGRGLSAATTNKVTHHVLPALLRDSEIAGYVSHGTKIRVMEGVRKVRDDAEDVCVALSLGERDWLLRTYNGHWAKPLVSFLFFTGVRVGEAAAIRQGDVDWNRRTVRIRHSRRGSVLSPAKSKRSQRLIQMPRAAMAAISPLRTDDDPKAFLFRSPDGCDLCVDNFRKRTWDPMIERSGIRKIRIHDTRHTFATLALEAGVPIAKVAAYVGDKIRTVEERYAHVLPVDDWDKAISAPGISQVV